MTRLPQQFIEDRALRDAARDVFKADIEHARMSISGKGIASRVGSRVGDGAKDVFEVAKVHADDNRGILAALIGAIVLFFARAPILELFGITSAGDDDLTEIDSDPADDIVEAENMPQDAETTAPAAAGDTNEQ